MQFIDLKAQQDRIRDRIDERIASVLDHGAYIMGPEIRELEEKLARFCGARHCITCANGTDALQLVLMALGTGPGDAVFVPAFTFAATAEVVPGTGATPVFVDIHPATWNICPESLSRAVTHAISLGLNPAVVIPVDLFGLPADYPKISAVAAAHDMHIIGDTAQGWGAIKDGQMTGTFGKATTTSFFPAKPLGCYGDGGAIFTDDGALADVLRSLRVHGKGTDKYDNIRIGMNSRLDTLQAAILLEKLDIYPSELDARQRVAQRYSAALHNRFQTPVLPEDGRSVWAQYTLQAQTPAARKAVMSALKAADIPSAVYYPLPLHLQTAYSDFPTDPGGLPVSEKAAGCVFSLPMHPYLTEEDQDRVISVLQSCQA